MKKGSILPIALMAFAIVAFLVLVNFAVTTNKNTSPQNVNVATANENQNVNLTVTTNENVNAATNINTSLNTNTTIDPTKGWKTYENKQYYFSFKYPADWQLIEEKYDPNSDDPFSSDHIWVGISGDHGAGFSVCPDQRGRDCSPFQDGQWDATDIAIVVDGKAAIKTSFVLSPGQNCPTCTPVSTVTFNERPVGWGGGRDFLLSRGKQDSSIPDTILTTFTFTDPTAGLKTLDEDLLVRVLYPQQYTLEKDTEQNRRGSFSSYNNIIPQTAAPYLQEIQFFSRESVEAFNKKCQNANQPCFFGDYPTVDRFDGLQKAYETRIGYKDYFLMTLGTEQYLVKNIVASGDGGFVREYNAFIGSSMVTLWVYIHDASENDEADALITPWQLEYNGF